MKIGQNKPGTPDGSYSGSLMAGEEGMAEMATAGGKSRITMRVDNDVLALFKARAEEIGGSYQTMMNDALKQFAHGLTLSEVIRQAIHDTFDTCLTGQSKCTRKRTDG